MRRNFVGQRDRVDVYKFKVNSSGSNVSLSLTGLRSNADLMVFNSRGNKLMQSVRSGARNEQMQMALDGGVYYMKVRSRGARGTNYRLTAAATPRSQLSGNPSNPSNPGNSGNPGSPFPFGSFNNPIDLGTLNGVPLSRSREMIREGEEGKYYKFQLADTSSIEIALDRVSSYTAVTLYYDANRDGRAQSGERISSGGGGASSSDPISHSLPAAGTYILYAWEASTWANSSTYDLNIRTTLTPTNPAIDPGSNMATAFSLGALGRGTVLSPVRQYVGKVDNNDVYRFDVATDSTVTFNLQATESVSMAVIQDSKANGLIDSGETVAYPNRVNPSVNLKAGTYYLEMRSLYDNAFYTLTMSA